MAQALKQKQVIIPLNKDATYLEAYRLTGGNLPSNVLHDRYLVETNDWKPLHGGGYYGAWAKEIVVYPATNEKFKKGKDIVDGSWIFDRDSVPQEAIGKNGVALFIKEPIIEEIGSKVIISAKPKDIVILQNFLQESGWGAVHDETRMPLESKNFASLSDDQKRYLWRRSDESVRPLARNANYYYGRRGVFACGWHDFALGVARVGTADAKPQVLEISGQISELIRGAKNELEKLSETVKSEKIESLNKLLKELRLKE